MIINRDDISWKRTGYIPSTSMHPTLDRALMKIQRLATAPEIVTNVTIIREEGDWFVSWWKLQPMRTT